MFIGHACVGRRCREFLSLPGIPLDAHMIPEVHSTPNTFFVPRYESIELCAAQPAHNERGEQTALTNIKSNAFSLLKHLLSNLKM